MAIVDFFDRIYVVNLPTRVDRLQSISEELKRVGITLPCDKVEIFAAIRPDEPAGFPEIGWRGCFLSHLNILRAAKQNNFSRILILEDDCLISSRLAKAQEKLVKSLGSQPWGFAYFGHTIKLPSGHDGSFVPYEGEVLTTHCYAVSASILDRTIQYLDDYASMVSRQRPEVDHGIDGVLSLFRATNPDVVTLLASPSLVIQSESASDISHGSQAADFSVSAVFKGFFRLLPLGDRVVKVIQSAKRSLMNR